MMKTTISTKPVVTKVTIELTRDDATSLLRVLRSYQIHLGKPWGWLDKFINELEAVRKRDTVGLIT